MSELTSTTSKGGSDLWDGIAAGLERDGDFAVREHFAAGRAVYTWEEGTPEGLTIKRYPDGRRELVRHHRDGDEVIRLLADHPSSGPPPIAAN